MRVLRIDEKYSVEYDETDNCRPRYWLRHGERSPWYEGNATTAMFYALLEKEEAETK